MGYEEEGRQSKFNAGVALTERIDSLQRAINAAKFNPFMRNFETGTFNYENLITAIDNLISEGWGKFSAKEKEKSLKFLNMLRDMNEFAPPVQLNGEDMEVNMDNYKQFIQFFGFCERKIKVYYDAHNLNAPSMDDDDDYDY